MTSSFEVDNVYIFENFAGQEFSFVDCTSFVIAKRVGVKTAFGFDDHFQTMHFFSLVTFMTLAHVLIIIGVSLRVIKVRSKPEKAIGGNY